MLGKTYNMLSKTYDTHGKLIRDIILLYQDAMDEAPEDGADNLHSFLRERGLSSGICLASLENLRVYIYGSAFLEEFTDGRSYFCATPAELMPNMEAIIESMQLRVARLQEMLPEWENVQVISEPGYYAVAIK